MSADANLAVTTDVEGYLRPTGAGVVDIGADEQGATAMPTTGYIPANLDGNRYFRYKAYLATADTAYTPSVDDITIGYFNYPTAATLTSAKFDTGAGNSFVKSLAWSEAGVTAAKDVKLQLSAAATSGGLGAFCGPRDATAGSCTAGTYFTAPAGSEEIDDAQIPRPLVPIQGFPDLRRQRHGGAG